MESFLSKIDKPQPFGTSGANNGGKGSETPGNGVVKQNNVKPKRKKKRVESLQLYNSKNNEMEVFEPEVKGKIIKRANEKGVDPLELSRHFCDEYNVDMSDLLCERPTKEPRVSDHIDQIKDMITKIINNDFAYEVDGDVFYSVEKFPNYGALSGQRLEHNIAGQ
ncbi:putative cysteine--tRNA ligase [Medicago truncatula]|uniref:Putative cysteine--tRNA ligase n=1 Tax=Medicago truncatula TaxID=3880 RepID=A0A396HIJ9_MEDTR|nr:putative cysteine--tRNA ligase [Medicago truncatula]